VTTNVHWFHRAESCASVVYYIRTGQRRPAETTRRGGSAAAAAPLKRTVCLSSAALCVVMTQLTCQLAGTCPSVCMFLCSDVSVCVRACGISTSCSQVWDTDVTPFAMQQPIGVDLQGHVISLSATVRELDFTLINEHTVDNRSMVYQRRSHVTYFILRHYCSTAEPCDKAVM